MASSEGEPYETKCSLCHDSSRKQSALPCAHTLCRYCESWLQIRNDRQCPVCREKREDITTQKILLERYVGNKQADLVSFRNPRGNEQADLVSFRNQRGNEQADLVSFRNPRGNEEADLVSFRNPTGSKHADLVFFRNPTGSEHADLISFTHPRGNRQADLVSEIPADSNVPPWREPSCCVCDDVAAVSMCLDCGDLLCQLCVSAHGKLSMSRDHVVKRLVARFPRPRCSVHSAEQAKHFCVTHDIAICSLCALSKHRSCAEMIDFAGKIKDARMSLFEIDSRLKEVEESFTKALIDLERQLVLVDVNHVIGVIEIDSTCDRLKAYIEQSRKRLQDLVHVACDEKREELHEKRIDYKHARARVISHRVVAQQLVNSIPATRLLEMTVMLESCIEHFGLYQIAPFETVTLVPVMFDPRVITRLQQHIDNLGNVSFQECKDIMRFHTNHGVNIILRNGQYEAEKTAMIIASGTFVLSSEPLKTNDLYQVILAGTDWIKGTHKDEEVKINVGLVCENPNSITTFRCLPWELRSSVIITQDGVYKDGKMTPSTCGNALGNIKMGSRVGVRIDKARYLHLYIDGEDQGVVVPDVRQPCWAVFDLVRCNKVTGYRIQTVKDEMSWSPFGMIAQVICGKH